MSGCVAQAELRCLQYRLRRMGMLELELWLQRLDAVLQAQPELLPEVRVLLNRDIPELEAMMRGRKTCPVALRAWLA